MQKGTSGYNVSETPGSIKGQNSGRTMWRTGTGFFACLISMSIPDSTRSYIRSFAYLTRVKEQIRMSGTKRIPKSSSSLQGKLRARSRSGTHRDSFILTYYFLIKNVGGPGGRVAAHGLL